MIRLESSSRYSDLRNAITQRRLFTTRKIDTNHPCPWWTQATQANHTAWLGSSVPAPIPWEQLDWTKKWVPGQPVQLETDGVSHIGWVRLVDSCFGSRWLRPYGETSDRRAHYVEISFRDPRFLWADPWVTQLAIALLSADTDQRCAWLRDLHNDSEPEMCKLLRLAREELTRPETPPPYGGLLPTIHPPKPKRVWSTKEIEALRMQPGWIETVDLAPGR